MSCLECIKLKEINESLRKLLILAKGELAHGEQKLTRYIANAQDLKEKLEAKVPDYPFGPIPHWINVKDRLPEEEQIVLLYVCADIYLGFLRKDKWYDTNWSILHPTYWMFLPLPEEK